jgi:hypothetical protein
VNRAADAVAGAFRMTDEAWYSHANPWSVYTRFAAIPPLVPVVTAGGSPGVSAAQLHAGRTGGQPEYDQVRGLPAGTPSEKLDPPIPQTNLRRQPLVLTDPWRGRAAR